MLSLILLATAAIPEGANPDAPADGNYPLPGSGFTLSAPKWHMSRWSDWDFKGRSPDRSVFVTAWSSSLQLTIDETVARELANEWKRGLEESEGATDVVISEVKVEVVAGQPRARATLDFASGSGIKGVAHAAAFSTNGLTSQLYTITAAAMRERGARQLETLLAGVQITRPPAPIGGQETLTTAAGTLLLPVGWRAPLATEDAEVSRLLGTTGASDVKACTPAIWPHVGGEADLLLACPDVAIAPVLDPNSFADESILFGQRIFGSAAASLPAAEQLPRGKESAILVHANDGLWVGGLTTATGYQVMWLSGNASRDADLGTTARAALTDFTLAPTAAPDRSFAVMLIHRLTYDRTHPLVLFPGLLFAAVGAFLVRMIFRSSARPGELDPTDAT